MNKMRKQIHDSLDLFEKEKRNIYYFVADNFICARMLKKLKVSFMVKHSKHIKGCRKKVKR
jgi:hypothetical protein